MDRVSGVIFGSLQQIIFFLRDLVSQLDVQPGYEEPHGLVVIISRGGVTLAVIPISGLLNVMLNRRGAE